MPFWPIAQDNAIVIILFGTAVILGHLYKPGHMSAQASVPDLMLEYDAHRQSDSLLLGDWLTSSQGGCKLINKK